MLGDVVDGLLRGVDDLRVGVVALGGGEYDVGGVRGEGGDGEGGVEDREAVDGTRRGDGGGIAGGGGEGGGAAG